MSKKETIWKRIKDPLDVVVTFIISAYLVTLSYTHFYTDPTFGWNDTLALLGMLFGCAFFVLWSIGRWRVRPIYDQLGWEDRAQVRQEFYDERDDGYFRRREEEQARERTHEEKEKRDAEEAQRDLYDHMPARVQMRSRLIHSELEQEGEYNDRYIGGTEEIIRICAPIPKFPDKEYYLLRDIASQAAEAIIDKVIGDHAEMLPGGVSHMRQWKVRSNLKNSIYKDMVYELTCLDRYYYTPDKISWTTEDFREASRTSRADEALA